MNILASEIKDFSNKVLKELIFVTPFLNYNTYKGRRDTKIMLKIQNPIFDNLPFKENTRL